MPDFDDINDPSELLGLLAGAVSLCWDPKPTGIFDAITAAEFVDAAVARLRVLINETAIRGEERWRIADAIATEEARVSDELDEEWDTYLEGKRDAYDHAEQIASRGG